MDIDGWTADLGHITGMTLTSVIQIQVPRECIGRGNHSMIIVVQFIITVFHSWPGHPETPTSSTATTPRLQGQHSVRGRAGAERVCRKGVVLILVLVLVVVLLLPLPRLLFLLLLLQLLRSSLRSSSLLLNRGATISRPGPWGFEANSGLVFQGTCLDSVVLVKVLILVLNRCRWSSLPLSSIMSIHMTRTRSMSMIVLLMNRSKSAMSSRQCVIVPLRAVGVPLLILLLLISRMTSSCSCYHDCSISSITRSSSARIHERSNLTGLNTSRDVTHPAANNTLVGVSKLIDKLDRRSTYAS